MQAPTVSNKSTAIRKKMDRLFEEAALFPRSHQPDSPEPELLPGTVHQSFVCMMDGQLGTPAKDVLAFIR